MVNFTTDQIREIMYKPTQIRNMSVIAHVDHGKSTLTDSLIAKAGIIAMKSAGDERYMDTRQDEKDRGITIKSTGVSLYFECKPSLEAKEEEGFLFNLIDSPGHVDFSSEVTAALRVTDGALVVVDAVEGVCVQTETVLRQAMQEKIKPVLFINKVDRNILELEVDGETMYKTFSRTIDNINVIVSTYESEDMGSLEIHPAKGNVAFGSGKDCWAFTLKVFADMYSEKLKVPVKDLMERFWGDNFFDSKEKVWRFEHTSKDGKLLKRAFAEFIMDPIIKIARAAMQNNLVKLKKLTKRIGVTLDTAEWDLRAKYLNKTIMQKWINAADSIMEMMVIHLPSPQKAQKYRYSYLYEGPKEDPIAIGIRDCDVNAPLCMYISKMIPTNDKGRFYAYGRVFSGKVSTGLKVIMLGPNYVPGKKLDKFTGNVQRTLLMMGRKTEFIPDIPCGNTGALVGIDKYLSKTGTITTYEESHNIRVMKYSVSPVVRVAIKPKNGSDLPKLVAGMKRLSKSDPLVLCINDENTGENIVAGSGELHVEICINDLEQTYAGIEIIRSNPIVTYQETISQPSSQTAMSKSANKHNRVYVDAQPLEEQFSLDIENGLVTMKMEAKEFVRSLVDNYGFDKNEAGRIWTFGPNGEGPNLILDSTSGCQFMNEIKDSVCSGFQIVTNNGVLCEEGLRGARFDVKDTTLHADSIHRGAGQLIPCSRRVLYAASLLSQPRLQEPIFLAEITCPMDVSGNVYSCLAQRRAIIEGEVPIEGTPLIVVKAYLPVSESFGFTAFLRSKTAGQAFPNCTFHHWDLMLGDPLAEENQVVTIVQDIRKRKGLKLEIPPVENYLDKL